MEQIRKTMTTVRLWFSDVGQEMRKIDWPEWRELYESTSIVIVMVLMLGVFVGICDKVLLEILRLLIPAG